MPRPSCCWVRLATAAVLVISITAARAAWANDVPAPFDTAGKILRIDAVLADQLGLFRADHPGFQEARLYRLPDSTYSLEITRRVNRSEARDRVALDQTQVDSLRALVGARILERNPSARYSREATPLLGAAGAVLGFGFYGWAVPELMNLDGETFAGAYIVTTAASILIPNILTKNRDVTYPAVTLGFYGATRGIAHGALVADMLGNDNDASEDAFLAGMLGASIAEGVAGYAWGSHLTPGQVGTIATGGDFGLGYGAAISSLSSDNSASNSAAALAGSAVGIAAGSVLGHARDYSYGDASIMRTGGIVAGYLGFALVDQGGDPSDDAVALSLVLGSAAGLAIGDRIVNGAGYSFGQSIGVDFMSLAGGMLALGVTYLATNDADDEVFTLTTAVGAATGYAVGVATQGRGGRPERSNSFGMNILPGIQPTHDGLALAPRVTAWAKF